MDPKQLDMQDFPLQEDVPGKALPRVHVRVQTDIFDPGAELTAFSLNRSSDGAVASFTGLVRAAKGETDSTLELMHYAGFTEKQMTRIGQAAFSQFDISDALIIHRHGEMKTGEPIVFVAVSAAHRRAAFEACEWLMDQLKTEAPFWKREKTASGTEWIEPTKDDHKRSARN